MKLLLIKIKNEDGTEYLLGNGENKFYHLPLNNAPVLEGVELLPPLEDEADKLAEIKYPLFMLPYKTLGGNVYDVDMNSLSRVTYKEGYNKAKEAYPNSDDDMVEFGEWCENLQKDNKEIRRNNPSITRKELLQLWKEQKPKLPTAFDTETKQYIY